MNVFLNTPSGRISAPYIPGQYIDSLVSSHACYYNGSLIMGPLSEQHNNAIIQAVSSILGGMQVFIREINGKTLTIDVEEETTVDKLKELILAKEPGSKDFNLFFAGKMLAGDTTLKANEISSEAVVMMILNTK